MVNNFQSSYSVCGKSEFTSTIISSYSNDILVPWAAVQLAQPLDKPWSHAKFLCHKL